MVVIFSPSLDFVLCLFFFFFAFDYHVFPSLDVVVSRSKHSEGTKELVPKSHFLDLDEELKNVNMGGSKSQQSC